MNPIQIFLIIAAVGTVALFVGLCIAALALRLFVGIAQFLFSDGHRTILDRVTHR